MLFLSVALLVGFLVLFKSADQFVIGSIATARNLNISPMFVGLTVVALGTSAPEIFVAATSSLQGKAELAVGNAIGSNIANIGMVLGITALLSPTPFRAETMKKDLPALIIVTLGAGLALYDYQLSIWDGLLLTTGLAGFLLRLYLQHKNLANVNRETILEMPNLEDIPEMSTLNAILVLALSLVFLLFSAEILVWTAVEFARKMGVSELVIGLTVIAVGTSLPELVVCVTSTLKGQTDLAIGNVVGSNVFNILAVLTIPCLLSPTGFSPELFWRDYMSMLAMTFLLTFTAYSFGFSRKARMSRMYGGVIFVAWLIYLAYLYHSTLPSGS